MCCCNDQCYNSRGTDDSQYACLQGRQEARANGDSNSEMHHQTPCIQACSRVCRAMINCIFHARDQATITPLRLIIQMQTQDIPHGHVLLWGIENTSQARRCKTDAKGLAQVCCCLAAGLVLHYRLMDEIQVEEHACLSRYSKFVPDIHNNLGDAVQAIDMTEKSGQWSNTCLSCCISV